MAKKIAKKRKKQFKHPDKERPNIAPVRLVDMVCGPDTNNKISGQYNGTLVPQLQWARKAENTNFGLLQIRSSSQVNEIIDTKTVVKYVKNDGGQLALLVVIGYSTMYNHGGAI